MITKLDIYKESILVPRNIENRKDKLNQQNLKLLSQEIIEGDLILDEFILSLPSSNINIKRINGSLIARRLSGFYSFPEWFKNLEITGNFIYENMGLESLKNMPPVIGGNINISFNELETLEYCNETINGDFNCSYNELTSIEDGPKYVKFNYNCSSNYLESLKGAPEKINGNFNCNENKLKSLKDGPKVVKLNYYCNNNIVKLNKPDDVVNDNFYN